MRSAPRVSAYASLAALLAFASACEGNNQPVSLSVRPDVLKATVPAALGTENTTCLHHSKVVANVEYTCADGKKHKGTALPRPEAKQPPACATDGETACLASGAFAAAETKALASKVLSGQTVAGVAGNITLPLASAVRSSATIGTNGATSGSIADCASDGQSECFVPASGAIKAANTANFTAWDVRRKRNSSGAVLTFAGVAGLSKTCRNRARIAGFDNTTSPAATGLDFFDTIDDFNGAVLGLPGDVPAWTMLIGGNTITAGNDFKCGGIYATGNVATGNTGADSSLPHDPDGNWQDLTPSVIPGGTNSTNPAEGCNAADKHCVFRELISGLMVTEVAPVAYTWPNAISHCDTLGETGDGVTYRLPIIGGAAYGDWRLPTQKELMQLSVAGIRGLNQTTNMTTYFGNLDNTFWSSSSLSYMTTFGNFEHLLLNYADGASKTTERAVVCVR